MIKVPPEDLITHQDKIYKCYFDKEIWVRRAVQTYNEKLELESKPIIELGLFDVLPWDNLYGSGNNILLVEHQLQNKDQVVKSLVPIPKSIYGIYHMPDCQSRWHSNIVKNFNCFINRNDPVRQRWFYTLYEHSLLEKSFSSFACLHRESGQEKSSIDNFQYFDLNHFNYLRSFDLIYHDVRKLLPYKNFVETGNLCDTILSTKLSLVIETYFERPDAITFSEKTFRVLQTPRPWLLFHATNAVEELRNMGFYVFDDFVDHSYDSIDTSIDSLEKQQAILKQLVKLMSIPISRSMIKHWEIQTLKNCEILKEFHQTWQHDVLHSLKEAYNIAYTNGVK